MALPLTRVRQEDKAVGRLLPRLFDQPEAIFQLREDRFDPRQVADAMAETGVRGVELVSVRDLSFLADLPALEHLAIKSDGRPDLGPVERLTELRSLDVSVGSVRGVPDLAALTQLRLLTLPGGKGSEAVLAKLRDGHPRLRFLNVGTRPRNISDLGGPFPNLVALKLWGEGLRSVDSIGEHMPALRRLHITFGLDLRSLGGIEALSQLSTFLVEHGLRDVDLSQLQPCPVRLVGELETDIAGLRGHPTLGLVGVSPKASIPDGFIDSLPQFIECVPTLNRADFFDQQLDIEDQWKQAVRAGWDDID